MGKAFAVVVALSVAAPAFAQIKSAKEQRQDFQRASGVCQASVNDQRGRGRGVARQQGLQGPGRRGRDREHGRDRPGPVGAPDSRPTHAHAGRPGPPAKREPRHRRAVGDRVTVARWETGVYAIPPTARLLQRIRNERREPRARAT